MVAVFTGTGPGLLGSSFAQLGGLGLYGNASHGRSGESVSLNAATGNLVISRQDEFLVGLGPDAGVSRIYNSQGAFDVNNDDWRTSFDRRVYNHVAGVSVRRISGDGSDTLYEFDSSSGNYIATDGDGAHDILTLENDVWTWDKDGQVQHLETYIAQGTTNGFPNWQLNTVSD